MKKIIIDIKLYIKALIYIDLFITFIYLENICPIIFLFIKFFYLNFRIKINVINCYSPIFIYFKRRKA